MVNIVKRITNWYEQRKERKYEEIINQYSSRHQELIRKGRNVKRICQGLQEFEKKTGLDVKVLGEVTYYKGTTPEWVPNYEDTVYAWLEIGRLNPDLLVGSGDETALAVNIMKQNGK